MVMNFEARGTQGPSWMFETSAGNGAVVAEWASLVPKPAGSSLTYEVYKRLPNDTDFTEFKNAQDRRPELRVRGRLGALPHARRCRGGARSRAASSITARRRLRLARRFALDGPGLAPGARRRLLRAAPAATSRRTTRRLWAVPFAVAAAVLFASAVAGRGGGRRPASAASSWPRSSLRRSRAHRATSAGATAAWPRSCHERWLPEGNVLMSGPYAATMVALHHRGVAGVLRAGAQEVRRAFHRARSAVRAAARPRACRPGSPAAPAYVCVWPLAGRAARRAGVALPRRTDSAASAPGGRLLLWVLAIPAILIAWPLVAGVLRAPWGSRPRAALAMAVADRHWPGRPGDSHGVHRGAAPMVAGRCRALATLACLAVVGELMTRYSDRHPEARQRLSTCWMPTRRRRAGPSRVDRPDRVVRPVPRRRRRVTGRPAALVPPWSSVDGVRGSCTSEAPVLRSAGAAGRARQRRPDRGRTQRHLPSRRRDGRATILSVWVNGVSALDVSVDGRRVDGAFTRRAPDDTAWTLNYITRPRQASTVSLTLRGIAAADRGGGRTRIRAAHAAGHLRPHFRAPHRCSRSRRATMTIVRRTYTF